MAFYTISSSPTIDSISRYVNATWKHIARAKIKYYDDSYFVILIQSVVNRDAILQGDRILWVVSQWL